jgi:hypothetical protein
MAGDQTRGAESDLPGEERVNLHGEVRAMLLDRTNWNDCDGVPLPQCPDIPRFQIDPFDVRHVEAPKVLIWSELTVILRRRQPNR